MTKTKIWKVHAEKLAEDLWERMGRNSTFDVLCDKELNDEWADDRRLLISVAMGALEDVFEVVEEPERLIPDEIRSKMLEDRSFLWDYAHTMFTGDGMEEEHAAELLNDEDDEFLLECYSRMCHD